MAQTLKNHDNKDVLNKAAARVNELTKGFVLYA